MTSSFARYRGLLGETRARIIDGRVAEVRHKLENADDATLKAMLGNIGDPFARLSRRGARESLQLQAEQIVLWNNGSPSRRDKRQLRELASKVQLLREDGVHLDQWMEDYAFDAADWIALKDELSLRLNRKIERIHAERRAQAQAPGRDRASQETQRQPAERVAGERSARETQPGERANGEHTTRASQPGERAPGQRNDRGPQRARTSAQSELDSLELGPNPTPLRDLDPEQQLDIQRAHDLGIGYEL